ncbi:MAG: DUF1254 domain-containing protein [Hyphomonadaceae bacterium]|jgi:hypothetical protein|nr:DUF1254 domain-containing protein [Hyphomonadaceae bacterium]
MRRAEFSVLAFIFAATLTDVQAQNFSAEEIERRTVERRAVEAIIWGMPAVNFDLMYQAVREINGGLNQIVYWSRLPDWKLQTLTPNPDAIYFTTFINAKETGPVVIEIPPADDGSITGTIMDAWQAALEDVGPAGVDKGRGGKYLVLPPGHANKVPSGYVVLPSDTNQGYALLRSILKGGSEADVAKAVAYGKRINVYPLAQAARPPPTMFIDAADVVFDSTIPYDLRFFLSLDRFVQQEIWLVRDKAMIDPLKSLGIEKGRPFNPDARMQRLLNEAAREAQVWLEVRYEAAFSTPYFEGRRWAVPASPDVIEGQQTLFANPDVYPIDGRGLTFSYAYFSAKHLGAGQFYLMTIRDRAGQPFDGGSAYRLTVPAHAPVTQYWSATVYDRATHALIRNLPRSSRSSQNPELQRNANGSVDVYFGPKAPTGMASNWVPTDANGKFEVLFRLYGPQKPLFDKTWTLPDIERMAAQ